MHPWETINQHLPSLHSRIFFLPKLLRGLQVTLLLLYCTNCLAISRIDINIGTINNLAGQIENFSASVDSDSRWQGKANFKQVTPVELTKLLPNNTKLPVTFSKGSLQGKVAFSGQNTSLQKLSTEINANDIAFGDTEGLHAGEKVGGKLSLNANYIADQWQWQIETQWKTGEVFWQPLYLTASHTLKASGILQGGNLTLAQGYVSLHEIGQVNFSGTFDLADHQVKSLLFDAQGLQATKGYEQLAKPFLEKTMLNNLEVAGTVDLHVKLGTQGMENININLHNLDMEDKDSRFAFYKINANIPWAADQPTQAVITYAGGKLLKLPLGAADLSTKLNGYSLTAPKLQIPLLGGALTVQDVSAVRLADRWHWHLRADLSPISLPEFSHAMGWPHMEGKVSASIPQVTYSNGQLGTDGAMLFRVFDGTIKISNLAMQEPLGLAPRLMADMEMRNLDMDMLTRTFSFGAITGRLDGDVNHLELSSWQPVKFDASFRSSAGDYPRKISQRAVENISALGGAGAAAAIQRSFLRFFDQFNYQRIGLSCKLRNGICQMDGAEPSQQGYVIVKGSGIPAITVMGYNRTVSWNDLLERIQRIVQGNTKAIIQ